MDKTKAILCGISVVGALLVGCGYVAVCAHNGRYIEAGDSIVFDTWEEMYIPLSPDFSSVDNTRPSKGHYADREAYMLWLSLRNKGLLTLPYFRFKEALRDDKRRRKLYDALVANDAFVGPNYGYERFKAQMTLSEDD